MIIIGGGITSDDLKIEETGGKCFDILLHYFSFGREDPIRKSAREKYFVDYRLLRDLAELN